MIIRKAELLLSHLCQIEIKVSDLGQSRTFYEQVLGLSAVPADLHKRCILAVPRGCAYGISLCLESTGSEEGQAAQPRAGVQPNRSVLMYFRVDSLAAIKDKLLASPVGSLCGERVLPGYGQALLVADPDGHVLGFFEPNKEQLIHE